MLFSHREDIDQTYDILIFQTESWTAIPKVSYFLKDSEECLGKK